MVNCSEAASLCESAFLFSAAGTCDVSGTCLCPLGHSVKDDWGVVGACVSVKAQDVIHVFMLATASVLMVLSVGCLFSLLRRWDMLHLSRPGAARKPSLPPLPPMTSSYVSSDMVPKPRAPPPPPPPRKSGRWAVLQERMMTVPRHMSLIPVRTPMQEKHSKKIAKRHRQQRAWLLVSVFFCFVNTLGQVLYFSGFLAGRTRFDALYQCVGLYLLVTGAQTTLYSVFYVFFLQLPSLRKFGSLFDVQSFLISRPTFVKSQLVTRIAIAYLYYFVFILIWPSAADSEATREALNTVALCGMAAMVFDFAIFSWLLVGVLLRLFGTMKIATRATQVNRMMSTTSPQSEKAVADTLTTLRSLNRAILVLGPLTVASLLATAFVPQLRSNLYVGFNLNIFFGNVALVTSLVLVLGFAAPRNETKKSAKPKTLQNKDDPDPEPESDSDPESEVDSLDV